MSTNLVFSFTSEAWLSSRRSWQHCSSFVRCSSAALCSRGTDSSTCRCKSSKSPLHREHQSFMQCSQNTVLQLIMEYNTVKGIDKCSLNNFHEISGTHFQQNPEDFLRDKPYNIKMQVKFVMSINEHVMTSSDQCSPLCLRSVIPFTR